MGSANIKGGKLHENLVLAKPGGEPLLQENAAEVYKAAQAFGNERLENGMYDCAYAFFKGGGFAIVNADSHDEVYNQLLKYPMFAQFIWEVKPLLDWNKTFESILGG
jgi:hypothetical protein